MVKLALTGERFLTQLRENPRGLDGVDVVWSGGDLAELEARAAELRPQGVVVDLAHLGDDPESRLRRLLDAAQAELGIVTYAFARRQTLEALQSERTRLLQGAVSLATLRSQWVGLVVRDILEREPSRSDGAAGDLVSCPQCGTRVPERRLAS